MNQFDQDFIRQYCEKYGIETSPGPGAPRLNGVDLLGQDLCSLFSEDPTADFYLTDITFKKNAKQRPFLCAVDTFLTESFPSFYQVSGYSRLNIHSEKDKLAPAC